jgi:hypothetical protein
MHGRAEVNSIQAAHCGRLDGLGQDPDARVQVYQVDQVQHGGQAGPRCVRRGLWLSLTGPCAARIID